MTNKINKKLRNKALRRNQILRIFKKSYLLYGVIAITGVISALITKQDIFVVFFVSSVIFAIITAGVHLCFLEDIQGNKPLTKKQRRRTVLILDVVKEESHFEVQYLKPGIRACDLNYSF